jgi:O-antigen ligase
MIFIYYFLVLSLPFVDHGLFGMAIGPVTLEKVLGAVCFIYALTYLPRRRELPKIFASAQAKAFTLYVGMAVSSYLLTAEKFDFNEMVGIFLSQFLFFITVMILVDSRERLENTVLWATASIGVVSLYLIREWVANVGTYGITYRPGWVAGDPNMFSASALIVLPMMLCPIRYAKKSWQRAGALFSLGVTLVAFVLAASRGGFIGLGCMALWQTKDWKRRVIAVALIAAVVAVCFVLPHSPLDRLLKPDESDKQSSDFRLQLWSISGKIFSDHPVLGVGLYNFPVYMHKYLPKGVDLEFVVPHNTYLEAAVELGSVGLLLFLGVIGLSVAAAGRMRRMALAAKDAYFTLLTTSIGSGIIGFAVAVMFLSAKHAKVFWFAVFLSACTEPLLRQIVAAKAKEEAAKNAVPPPAASPDPAPNLSAPAAASEPIRVGNWLMRH